jgi:hypothetical protein
MEENMLHVGAPGECCGLASRGHSVGCRIHIAFEVGDQADCVSMAAVSLRVVGVQDQSYIPLHSPTGHRCNPQA